jgi:hypothetical protein
MKQQLPELFAQIITKREALILFLCIILGVALVSSLALDLVLDEGVAALPPAAC